MQNLQEKFSSKLGVYQEFLESKGFDKINLDIILREKADSISRFDVGGSIDLPIDLRAPFTPLGNPPPFMAAYAISGDHAYGMIFLSEDTAVSLITSGPKERAHNPLMFMHILEEKMGQILLETRDNVDVLNEDFVESEISFSLGEFVHIDQIDMIIYDFLTNRPILILGPVDQAINILVIFLSLIPETLRWKYGYSINMPYFPQDSIIFGILDNVNQYDLENEVNMYLDKGHSIVNLFEKSSYGEFTCRITREIVDVLRDNNMKKAQELVSSTYELAKQVQPGESAKEFGDRLGQNYDDADLIVDVATFVLEVTN